MRALADYYRHGTAVEPDEAEAGRWDEHAKAAGAE